MEKRIGRSVAIGQSASPKPKKPGPWCDSGFSIVDLPIDNY